MHRFRSPESSIRFKNWLKQEVQIHVFSLFLGVFSSFDMLCMHLSAWQLNHHRNYLDSGVLCTATLSPPPPSPFPFSSLFLSLQPSIPCYLSYSLPLTSSPFCLSYRESGRTASFFWYLSDLTAKKNTLSRGKKKENVKRCSGMFRVSWLSFISNWCTKVSYKLK